MAQPKTNPLADPERVATDEEAKVLLREFFSSLSPSEVRRMYSYFMEFHGKATGVMKPNAKATGL